MKTELIKNPEESENQQKDYTQFPFDGFVNVNAIVKKRRQLKNAVIIKNEADKADPEQAK